MGKLFCDSTAAVSEPTTTASFLDSSSPWIHPPHTQYNDESLDSIPGVDSASTNASSSWDHVPGLEDQQRNHLKRLFSKGVLWKNPKEKDSQPVVFLLSHGGEVSTDGNCLFTENCRLMELTPWLMTRTASSSFRIPREAKYARLLFFSS